MRSAASSTTRPAQPCVRGVTFQPVQAAGRTEGFDPARDRLTLTEVRRRILEQTDLFRPEDLIPVPCHPDALAMAYALKIDGRVAPLTGLVDPRRPHRGRAQHHHLRAGSRTCAGRCSGSSRPTTRQIPRRGRLRDLLCCLPRVAAPGGIGYRNVFRVLIMQFIDAQAFDVRSVKKTCVHIVHPDGRLIPFDTYNLFYRDDLEQTRLGPLREAVAAGGAR